MTTNESLLKVVAAEYMHDYTLRLTFLDEPSGKAERNTGEVRLVDFLRPAGSKRPKVERTPLMQKGICRKLQDLDYFKSLRLDPFTVDWNDEIGFAPQYLYERGGRVKNKGTDRKEIREADAGDSASASLGFICQGKSKLPEV